MRASIRRLLERREAGLAGALLCACTLLAIASPHFLTVANLLTIGRNASEVGILALGMTIVLILGQVDLSVGSTYAAGAIATGTALAATGSTPLAIAAGLSVGALVGLLNGVAVGYFHLNSFMVTLGTLNIVRGLVLLETQGASVSVEGHGIPQSQIDAFSFLGSQLPGGINMELIIFLALAAVTSWALRSTKLGFDMFATGGNQEAARIAGLRVPVVIVVAFVISGLFAALAGVLALSFVGTMAPSTGGELAFDVFAAAVIGGASLSGGRGSMLGTLLGALFLSVARNGFILIGVSSSLKPPRSA